jgi:hypothetical protein
MQLTETRNLTLCSYVLEVPEKSPQQHCDDNTTSNTTMTAAMRVTQKVSDHHPHHNENSSGELPELPTNFISSLTIGLMWCR